VRITADSNIYVSAILFGGKPLALLKLGHSRHVRLFISDEIIEETLGVLREKFKRTRERVIVAEEYIRACTYVVAPTERLNVVPDDEDDNRVLECAVAGGCEYIVTGDRDLLRMGTYRDTSTDLNSLFEQAIMALMKTASITEARNSLSALIDGLKRGSSVLIVDRGRPVARLEPVTSGPDEGDVEGRLARLSREGVVRPGRGPLPKTLTTVRPPSPKRGASGVRALLDERQQGR